ncbi:hypothetical protein C8A03DRAFT_31510 [Achaetomium macrosporum]|uniref:F-box domain-containing protein n=1 Tax=Achaetomium macrosporum TaxID=79813 RepID=A0AAN7CE54_9PEZI|nr:hypothetical protein C8A03DRAFT_31510 [Achaetomium macrosporum]
MTAEEATRSGASGFESFETLPPEMIVQILQSCTTTEDVVALASTCGYIYHVWQANAAATLWPLLLRKVPHLHDALVAARMTQLVVDAEGRDEVPPIGFSPGQLECPAQPSLAELRASLDLHRLSREMAESFFAEPFRYYKGVFDPNRYDYDYDDYFIPRDRPGHSYGAEEAVRKGEWMDRMCHTILKVFTVWPALTGAYSEPIRKAKGHPDPEVQVLAHWNSGRADHWDCIKRKAVPFLTQFAVYDLEAPTEALDAVFGPAADWLLASFLSDRESRQAMAKRFDERFGRAGYCLSLEGSCPVGLVDGRGDGSHSDAHHVVWQLMRMLWVVEHTRPLGLGLLREFIRRSYEPLPPPYAWNGGRAMLTPMARFLVRRRPLYCGDPVRPRR